MDEIIQNAKDRIATLKRELEILEDFVRSAEPAVVLLSGHVRIRATVTGELSVDEAEPESRGAESSASTESSVKRTRVTDNPKPSVLVPAAIEIIRQHGHPMSRRQLHEALSERGLIVKGTDPIKALGTILWRARDQIVQLEGRGYWPKSDPYRPASYVGSLFDNSPDGTPIRTAP